MHSTKEAHTSFSDLHCNKEIYPKLSIEVRWEYPPNGWIKLNIDGASKANSGPTSYVRIIRNSPKIWIADFSKNIGICNSFQAELWGVVEGLDLVWQKGFRNVISESNSKLLVEMLSNKTSSSNIGSSLLLRCALLIQRD